MISVSPQWYTRKWVVVSLHVLFWSLILVFPYLIKISVEHNSNSNTDNDAGNFYLAFALENLMRALLFYVNAYFFIPKLAYSRRFGQYLTALLVTFCLLTAWNRFIYSLFMPGLHFRMWSYALFELPFYIILMLGSTAFRVVADKIREQQRVKEKETENLKTELSFLRSQVSPHFMFNVLNNMVALARKKSDLLEPSLIKLSSLLRYMLYETDEDKVLLEKEIEYLKSFIELQAQRFGKNMDINTSLRADHRRLYHRTYAADPLCRECLQTWNRPRPPGPDRYPPEAGQQPAQFLCPKPFSTRPGMGKRQNIRDRAHECQKTLKFIVPKQPFLTDHKGRWLVFCFTKT